MWEVKLSYEELKKNLKKENINLNCQEINNIDSKCIKKSDDLI